MWIISDVFKQFDQKLGEKFSAQEKRQLAQSFLCTYLNCTSTDLILHRNKELSAKIQEKIEIALSKINKGQPAQYVLGFTYFYDLKLRTDKRALIPRPETEELVTWVMTENKQIPKYILDIGTGTGCIPLALKKQWKSAEIVGIDIEKDALLLAKENAETLDLSVQFYLADALKLTEFSKQKWDIIISNPPYIPLSDKATMQRHVVDYEPHSSLFVSDNDPLLFYNAIAQYAMQYLTKYGQLYFEIHENYAHSVVDLLKNIGFNNVVLKEDLEGKPRMIKGAKL